MLAGSENDYPSGFADLVRHVEESELPVVEHGAELCAAAVLFSVDCLHPRTMAAVATEILASPDRRPPSSALCEVAASTDPDQDPNIRAAFRTFLAECDLVLSGDEGWDVLARLGARRARDIAAQMIAGVVDPVDGARSIARCFIDYLPDEERRRLVERTGRPALDRSRPLEPFVEFTQVDEDLYQAGVNLHEWNDRLPYAPSNVMSADEREAALTLLRARYVELAGRCVEGELRRRG